MVDIGSETTVDTGRETIVGTGKDNDRHWQGEKTFGQIWQGDNG